MFTALCEAWAYVLYRQLDLPSIKTKGLSARVHEFYLHLPPTLYHYNWSRVPGIESGGDLGKLQDTAPKGFLPHVV